MAVDATPDQMCGQVFMISQQPTPSRVTELCESMKPRSDVAPDTAGLLKAATLLRAPRLMGNNTPKIQMLSYDLSYMPSSTEFRQTGDWKPKLATQGTLAVG